MVEGANLNRTYNVRTLYVHECGPKLYIQCTYIVHHAVPAGLDPEILKNYRPVSSLSFVSKVLERVVAQRLTSYMTDSNLHEYLQSAYKPSHSTETALLKVQNDIPRSIDQYGIVILILLDLSAAFDTIDHDVLFSRMESTLGITGPALEWFRSYLGDRTP